MCEWWICNSQLRCSTLFLQYDITEMEIDGLRQMCKECVPTNNEECRYKLLGFCPKTPHDANFGESHKIKEIDSMLTVGQLRKICERIEKEYGSDCNVIMQFRNSPGESIINDYARSIGRSDDGTLILINRPFKEHV